MTGIQTRQYKVDDAAKDANRNTVDKKCESTTTHIITATTRGGHSDKGSVCWRRGGT